MGEAKIGVLVSGRGSNLAALLDAAAEGRLGGRIVVVLSDVADAPALAIARARGVEARSVPAQGGARLSGDGAAAFVEALRHHAVDVVVLAGFMRIVGRDFLDAFPDRVVNIHPSLLPAFRGRDAQRQALDYGVKVAGCTVHLVDDSVDAGPIIAQECVPVADDDSAETLAARILAAEHRVLPAAVRLVAEGRLRREGRRTWVAR